MLGGCCASTVCMAARIRVNTKYTKSLLFTGSAPNPKVNVSLDHLVSPIQHRLWNGEANLLRSLQVND